MNPKNLSSPFAIIFPQLSIVSEIKTSSSNSSFGKMLCRPFPFSTTKNWILKAEILRTWQTIIAFLCLFNISANLLIIKQRTDCETNVIFLLKSFFYLSRDLSNFCIFWRVGYFWRSLPKIADFAVKVNKSYNNLVNFFSANFL